MTSTASSSLRRQPSALTGLTQRVFAIGLNTFREAVRDRVLYGVLALAVAVLVFSLALAQLSLDQERRVVEDIGLASISLFSVVIAVFLGSSLLYKEIERKTLYVVLPKPLHRWEFLVGKFVGIAWTATVFVLVMGAVQLFVMGVQASGPSWTTLGWAFGVFVLLVGGLVRFRDPASVLSWWAPCALGAGLAYVASTEALGGPVLMALVLNLGEVFVLAAVALFFSAFSTPLLTGLLTTGVWVVGRSADTMQTIQSRLLSGPIEDALHALAVVVPNFNLFVPGRNVLHGADAWRYVGESVAYGAVYTTLLLISASLIFRRRDFV